MVRGIIIILLDFSQIAIACVHILKDIDPIEPLSLKFGILNSIRRINKNFRKRFGQLVIATDNTNYWRKSAFKYYKANRKKDRDDSGIDWPLVFSILNDLRDEIKENFPYKVMDVPGAEADDVIGVIAKHFHEQEGILIVSGDHDFMQLQRYNNVWQYGPVQDKLLMTADPAKFLFEHILHGDKGDGVPNFLSADDSFIEDPATGKKPRQTPIYQVKVDAWYTQKPENFCNEKMLANYYRNKKLVDLTEIPADIEAAILAEFSVPPVGTKDKIYGYLVKSRMRNLLTSIQEF